MRTRGRRWARALLVVLLVPCLLLAGLWLYLRTGVPEVSGRVAVAGVQHETNIYRDADGVPHIFARTVADGYRALGYVHAQDRLFQMDLMRRVASGRLAEAIGGMGLENDRFMRTLGLRALAARDFPDLSAETRNALIAYAEGVNSYLYHRKGALPPEYLLFPAPESWTPTDSLLWGKLMGMALSGNWRDEALRGRMAAAGMPAETVDLLFGRVGTAGRQGAAATETWRDADPALRRILASLPPLAEPRTASNAWALAGSRTASGKPLLASDPHLSLTAPSLWYLARIVTDDGVLAGATAPGVPFLVLGHNGRIAWGMTTTGADTQDLVLERLTDDGAATVERPDGTAEPIDVRTETLRVRWAADEILTVRRTTNGPILSDLPALTPGIGDARTLVALRATFLQPGDRSAEALLGLSRAADWTGFAASVRTLGAPMQNFVMAGTAGEIGMIAAARLPLRRQGGGWMPARGWERDDDWTGYASPAMLPQWRDPPQGYVANANNPLVAPDYPVTIAESWDDSFRGDRLADQLEIARDRRVADEAALQMDTLSPFAQQLVALMDGWEPADADALKALTALRAWDKHMRRTAREPLLFAEFGKQLMEEVLADDLAFLDQDGRRPWRPRAGVLLALLKAHTPLCDDTRTPVTETCRDRMAQALTAAERAVGAGATWGDAHPVRHEHPVFGRIPLLGRLFSLALPADGGNDTLQRMAYWGRGFAAAHGAGYRAVYDLADLDSSGFVITTGQSGHRLSPYYDSFLLRARNGALRPLAGTSGGLAQAGAALLTLTPP